MLEFVGVVVAIATAYIGYLTLQHQRTVASIPERSTDGKEKNQQVDGCRKPVETHVGPRKRYSAQFLPVPSDSQVKRAEIVRLDELSKEPEAMAAFVNRKFEEGLVMHVTYPEHESGIFPQPNLAYEWHPRLPRAHNQTYDEYMRESGWGLVAQIG